jgi:hypothetical protein
MPLHTTQARRQSLAKPIKAEDYCGALLVKQFSETDFLHVRLGQLDGLADFTAVSFEQG